MLEFVTQLLVALAVALGGHGPGPADDHAAPQGNPHAIDAIEAMIERVTAAVETARPETAGGKPESTGLGQAREVADEHAADRLDTATQAPEHGGGPADVAPADAPVVDAPPVDAPPVDVPVASGPPASHPPVPAPPVPAPPVDAPGIGNRP